MNGLGYVDASISPGQANGIGSSSSCDVFPLLKQKGLWPDIGLVLKFDL